MTSMTDQTAPKGQPLALFDFDDTISIGDTMLHWQRWYLQKRRSWWMLPWIWGGCALKSAGFTRLWFKRFYMATSNRETESSRENLVREFRRELLSQIVYPELVERAWLHHQLGDSLCVVSASPEFLLSQMQEILPPHRLVATRLGFEGNHLWNLPELIGHNIKGEGKVDALREEALLPASPESFAYSDHHSDTPLLEAVDFPVAVRPDALLAKTASSLGWQQLNPIAPWRVEDAWKTKARWLLMPLGVAWPSRRLPEKRARKRLWKRWRQAFSAMHASVLKEDREGFELSSQEFEKISVQLKGLALRMAQSLIQKPSSRQGLPDTGRLDRQWGSGLQQALTPPEIDSMRQMVVELPGFDASAVSLAPFRSSAMAQYYRAHRPDQDDGVLKLFLPSLRTTLEADLNDHAVKLPKGLPEEACRAWNGLLRELSNTATVELDPTREETASRKLAPLFLDPELGIRLPWAKAVYKNGLEGVFYEAVEGYPLPIYFAYLRETRRLRDPHAHPDPDFHGFASLVARSGDLPQGRALSQRLWTLLSYSFWHAGVWLPLGNWANATVIPGLAGSWKLGVRDLAGCVEFTPEVRNLLRRWEELEEGSGELRSLLLQMGWSESHLVLHAGRWRDLVELVWHPLLYGNPQNGFGFETWRLDGRLQGLLGAGHVNAEWPIPDGLRPIFRTMYWLRRNLAGVIEA